MEDPLRAESGHQAERDEQRRRDPGSDRSGPSRQQLEEGPIHSDRDKADSPDLVPNEPELRDDESTPRPGDLGIRRNMNGA